VLDGGTPHAASARGAAAFIRTNLWDENGRILLRRFRKGSAGVPGYAEDYAYLIFGLLDVFQAGGEPEWLEWALTLQRRMDELFWDASEGGWYSTTGTDPSVLLRMKEEYDGAEPAASSVGVLNLLALSHLTPDEPWAEKVEQTLALCGARPSMRGRAVPMMMAALSTYHAGMLQVVVAGEPDSPGTRALWSVVRRHYLPGAVLIPVRESNQADLARLLPWTASLRPRNGHATAYVCRDRACQAPTSSPEELERQLAPRTGEHNG
jgi:uncharacterized protein YyaL (SSP411 family)